MAEEMDRIRVLKSYAPQIPHRIELISTSKLDEMESLELGILFVMAFWSASSVRMFQKLGDVLNAVDVQSSIRLWVVDTDDISNLYGSPPFDRVVMGGNGEVFWIRDGKVVSDSGGGYNPDCLEINTRQLLID